MFSLRRDDYLRILSLVYYCWQLTSVDGMFGKFIRNFTAPFFPRQVQFHFKQIKSNYRDRQALIEISETRCFLLWDLSSCTGDMTICVKFKVINELEMCKNATTRRKCRYSIKCDMS